MPVRLHIIKRIFSKCTLGFKTLNRYEKKIHVTGCILSNKQKREEYLHCAPVKYSLLCLCNILQIKRFFTTLITLILAFCWFCFVLGHLIILTTPYTVYFLSNQPIPTFFEPTKLKFRTLNQFLPSRYGAGQNITQNTSS